MNDTTHTPGPWIVTTQRTCGKPLIWIYQESADKSGPLKTVYDAEAPDVWALSEADAALISAAPDLLKACKHCLTELEHGTGFDRSDELRAAIAKAKGR